MNPRPPLQTRNLPAQPVADPAACIHRPGLRISVLTPRIVRIESGENFEDRPTLHFWNRLQPVPPFTTGEADGRLWIETEHATVGVPLGRVFLPAEVLAAANGSGRGPRPPGDAENLGGCLRTLDTVRGRWNYTENRPAETIPGLFSREGWVLVDDSAGLAFRGDGFPEPRPPGAARDYYVIASGRDFAAALSEYYAVAGRVPLLPKWVLGLWWSRWEAYKQADFERIADEFDAHGVPLSVCVVDMDWHLPGWTGFTWNKDFFPDPAGFFRRMHARGIRACLNLHPHGGVRPSERAYGAMALHMGADPAAAAPIPFDIADPRFIEGYFKHLLHPLEGVGVDFWWMDWQQGTQSNVPGLDPLWMLNHLHALDRARDGSRRPLAFSRWGGWGAHRYPVGFSGDSSRTWDTLEFEVELTAQSANTGFGWWSHDIGGFCDGMPDDELYVRWVQFGALSPVFRFHNCGDPTLDYRPWSKDGRFREAALSAMRLRRALVPYLYTAAHANHLGAPPPCTPMYYGWPGIEDAYHCPGQYRFGPDLIAAPVCSPACPETRLPEKAVWLPPGDWFDFSNGSYHEGGRWTLLHPALDSIPLFARGGSAIPVELGGGPEWILFPGNGTSACYDDAGEGMEFEGGEFRLERCSLEAGPDSLRIRIENSGQPPAPGTPRRFRLRGFGDARPSAGGTTFEKDGPDWLSAPTAAMEIDVRFDKPPARPAPWGDARFWELLHRFHINCHAVRQMKESGTGFASDIRLLAPYLVEFSEKQVRLLVSEALGCGVHVRRESADRDWIAWWNHSGAPDFRVLLSRCEWLKYHLVSGEGAPHGRSLAIEHRDAVRGWSLRADFAGLATFTAANDKTGACHASRQK